MANGDYDSSDNCNDSGNDALLAAALLNTPTGTSTANNTSQPQAVGSTPLTGEKVKKSLLKRWILGKAIFTGFLFVVAATVFGPYFIPHKNANQKTAATPGAKPASTSVDTHAKKSNHAAAKHDKSASAPGNSTPHFAQKGTIQAVVANEFIRESMTATGGANIKCDKKVDDIVVVSSIISVTPRGVYGATAYLTDICPGMFKSDSDATAVIVVTPPKGQTFTVKTSQADKPEHPSNKYAVASRANGKQGFTPTNG